MITQLARTDVLALRARRPRALGLALKILEKRLGD
jgi:hypothetical protein